MTNHRNFLGTGGRAGHGAGTCMADTGAGNRKRIWLEEVVPCSCTSATWEPKVAWLGLRQQQQSRGTGTGNKKREMGITLFNGCVGFVQPCGDMLSLSSLPLNKTFINLKLFTIHSLPHPAELTQLLSSANSYPFLHFF